MTTTNQKSYWAKLCEFVVRRQQRREAFFDELKTVREKYNDMPVPERPAMDVDENDRVLAQLNDGDPAYRTLMNYAYVHVENNMGVAFDVARSVDDQRDFKNRAAGVAAFIADVETTRARLKQEILDRQKRDNAKKK
jgi:hypothetical protein